MSTASGMPDRFTTVVGQPSTIALKYKTGKLTKTGNTMYTLTSGLVAFFPPHVAVQIDALHLDPGMPFSICHHGRDCWEVERVVPAARNAALPRTSPPQPVSRAPLQQSTPQGPVNGQGEDSAAILSRCYVQAIEIALASTVYAEKKGLRITPAFEDIRAMAAVLCIGGRA